MSLSPPIASDLAVAIAVLTCVAVVGTLWIDIISNRRAMRTERAQLYFTISERWAVVLKALYRTRGTPPPSLEELEDTYPNVRDFMQTGAWKDDYRLICNFFEDMGLIVHQKSLPVTTIQVLVTVSENDYRLMRPVLQYLRKHYRPDIYVLWNYLLARSSRARAIQPFRGRVYEPS